MPRRPNPDVRVRLLSAGRSLLLDQGFHGSGVNDLTASAGVPKGSFYSYFASKDAFAVEVLEDYWGWVLATFGPILDNADRPAGERLAAFFRSMAEDHEQHDFSRFCLVGNLALEMAGTSEAARAKVSEILVRWQAMLATCVEAGRARGEVRTRRDPRETAELLVEAWEGAVLRSKIERTPHACHRFETVTLPMLLA